MKIRRIFQNEEELTKKLGETFMRRWKKLHEIYRIRKKITTGMDSLRCATVAFAFYGAALEGNTEVMQNFDSMIHGEHTDYMEIENQLTWFDNDTTCTFIWDTAALMLETNDTLSQYNQTAFDLAGQHVWMAYNAEVMAQGETVQTPPPPPSAPVSAAPVAPAAEVKTINTAVPLIPDNIANYLIEEGKKSGDPQKAAIIKEIIINNIMQRYHNDMNQKLEDMTQAVNEAARQPIYKELVLNKQVQNEIGHIGSGGTGFMQGPSTDNQRV